MVYSTLISTSLLGLNLTHPDWVVVDCRFDLNQPDWGREDYLKGHIPGAVYAHLAADLSGLVNPKTGRHPLPNPQDFIRLISNWGINQKKQVIAYDTTGGSFAARLWWLLRCYGHQNVAVLNGGYTKWLSENRPIHTGYDAQNSSVFEGSINNSCFASDQEVDLIRSNPGFLLIDARAKERFLGEQEPIDPIAGHIPGAVNRPYALNLNSDSTFLPPKVLESEFNELLGKIEPNKVVIYCGSGVTSCHHLLAMEYIGMKGARLYPGSWSEWIRDPNHLIALG